MTAVGHIRSAVLCIPRFDPSFLVTTSDPLVRVQVDTSRRSLNVAQMSSEQFASATLFISAASAVF